MGSNRWKQEQGIVYLGSNSLIHFYYPPFAAIPDVLYNSLWPGIMFICNSVIAFSVSKDKKRVKLRTYQCTSMLCLLVCIVMFTQGCKDILLHSSTQPNGSESAFMLILLIAFVNLLSSIGGLVSCSGINAVSYIITNSSSQTRINAVLPSVIITGPPTAAVPSLQYSIETNFAGVSPPPPYENFAK